MWGKKKNASRDTDEARLDFFYLWFTSIHLRVVCSSTAKGLRSAIGFSRFDSMTKNTYAVGQLHRISLESENAAAIDRHTVDKLVVNRYTGARVCYAVRCNVSLDVDGVTRLRIRTTICTFRVVSRASEVYMYTLRAIPPLSRG